MPDNSPALSVPTRVLRAALKNGAPLAASADGRSVIRPLSVVRLAMLAVPSGHLIAGDVGLGFDIATPFVRRVPADTYEVFVSIWGRAGRGKGPSDDMGDTPRAAYLALVLAPGEPASYEFAATGDQPPGWAPSDAFEGFGVDVGGVGLMDAGQLDAFQAVAPNLDMMELNERAFTQRPELARVAGVIEIPTDPPIRIPAAESGWGDGSYFSYWGLSARDEPMVLIVDFDLDRKWESEPE